MFVIKYAVRIEMSRSENISDPVSFLNSGSEIY